MRGKWKKPKARSELMKKVSIAAEGQGETRKLIQTRDKEVESNGSSANIKKKESGSRVPSFVCIMKGVNIQ